MQYIIIYFNNFHSPTVINTYILKILYLITILLYLIKFFVAFVAKYRIKGHIVVF